MRQCLNALKPIAAQNSNRDGFGYETYKENGLPTGGRPAAKTTSGTKKVVKKVRPGIHDVGASGSGFLGTEVESGVESQGVLSGCGLCLA